MRKIDKEMEEKETMSRPIGVMAPTDSFAYPVMDIDIPLLLLLSERTVQPGDQYKLGGKAPSLKADSAIIRSLKLDCSGYVRWILHRATDDQVVMPDGSDNQAEWLDLHGFKRSTVDAWFRKDGVVRIVHYNPIGKVGHIAVVLNGETIESHGKAGPDRREWTGEGWQGACSVWCLTSPSS